MEFINKNNKTGSYTGMTKWKIKDWIKEHHSDISHNRQITALAQLSMKKKIKIDFNNMKELASFNNSYAIKRETCEIITDPDSCNLVEHAQLHPSWKKILESSSCRGTKNNVMQNVADEGGGTLRKCYNEKD